MLRNSAPVATRLAGAAPSAVAFLLAKSQANGLGDKLLEVLALRLSFLAEFWAFLRVRKKYWLLPAVLTMLAFGGLIVITQTSSVAPMIYTIF